MSNKLPYHVKTIQEFHQLRGLPAPEHPLISIIDYSLITRLPEATSWTQNFYFISLKRTTNTKIKYGQQVYDFDSGVLFFMAPNQVFSISVNQHETPQHTGCLLLIHPDFLWNTSLAKTIKQYDFFDYSVNEALFLSEKEETIINGIIENIHREYQSNIDKFTQQIIISQLETLLGYSERFYNRQFITRKKSNHQILDRLEKLLTDYFESDALTKNGLPGVEYISHQLLVSPGYLRGLLKSLTGLSTQEHIHNRVIEKAKEKLSSTSLSVSEIAYELGFDRPQSFSRLFKLKAQLSPLEFRESFRQRPLYGKLFVISGLLNKLKMKKFTPAILALFVAAAFSCNNNTQKKPEQTLAEARKGFKTRLIYINKIEDPAEEPPQDLFSMVSYPAPIGNMTAYLGKIPDDGKLHPAIIWITGGFGNDIGDVWSEARPDNDQSAAAYRKAGIVMMHPAQRGGNGNPGSDESFFGEIDDIIAAADFLAKQKGIDPNRIYLGGHSTGGTKALLAAECTNKFRAVFSFGPATTAAEYGPDNLTYNIKNEEENKLRSPSLWLSSLQTPVFVFEGDQTAPNMDAVKDLERIAKQEDNKFLHCHIVKGKDHFSVLQPTNEEIAQKILADDKKGLVNMSFE